MLGVHADVARRVPIGFTAAGASIVLLGRTAAEFGGSAWAHVAHRHIGGRPPAVDLAAERALASVLTGAADAGLLDAAHDLSEGGLAVALAECCLSGGLGCQVSLPGDPFTELFSESAARAVLAVRPGADQALAELAAQHGVPAQLIGTVGGGKPGRHRDRLRHPVDRARRREHTPRTPAGAVRPDRRLTYADQNMTSWGQGLAG